MTATRREVRSESDAAEDADTLALDDQSVPIPLRLKKEEVLRDYTVELLDDETLGDWTLHHLRLTPRPDAEGETDRVPLDLWFDSATLLLTKVVTTEGEDEIELLFAPNAMEPNAELAPGTFDTTLPDPADGWEVQEVPLG
jgi:outer membrane lipoprotein-sorting protein